MVKSIRWNSAGRMAMVEFDHPLGDDGTAESILRALADKVEEELKRRADPRNKARMEIFRAASDICDTYGVKITVEVST